ncbi:MAG: TniQ family protein [Ferrovibrio sp.]|uniref:TniQ family protein n=1 Tax=Ferrovibrio sp. TaxID=1917215 RepID=UPI0039196E2D
MIGLPLVIRAPPLPEESCIGYLLRLSSLNGYKSPLWLWPTSGFHPHEITPKHLTTLPSSIGVPPKEWGTYFSRRHRKDTVVVHGFEVPKWHVDYKNPKICPLCLREKPILLARWDLTLWTACERHEIMLIRDCSNCGSPIRWEREKALECGKCGSAFSKSDHKRAAEKTLQYVKLLRERMLSLGINQVRFDEHTFMQLDFDCLLEFSFEIARMSYKSAEGYSRIPSKKFLLY